MFVREALSLGRYYTVDQAGELAQLHPNTIRRAIYQGELSVWRNGLRGYIRIPESELNRWMQSKQSPAK